MVKYILLLLPLFTAFHAFAKPQVYTWQDENGVTHYSSKPTSPAAKAAELPEINRGDLKLATPNLISCSNHGGIDCQAGADDDGSVICHDGFREASARFRFSCNAAKLQITGVGEVDENGNFTVTVRNAKSVKAVAAAVLYTPEPGIQVSLLGPQEVDPYGVVEYRFEPKDADIPQGKVTLAEIEVKCGNCS